MAALLAFVAVAAVTVADLFTGEYLWMSAFYVLAVMLATRSGRRWGIACAVAAGLASGLAEILVYEPRLHFETPFPLWMIAWNTASRMFVYAVIAVVVSGQRRALTGLRQALSEIRTLEGLLPMCAWCKQIRDEADAGRWKPVDQYVSEHTEADFTHGICPPCAERMTARP